MPLKHDMAQAQAEDTKVKSKIKSKVKTQAKVQAKAICPSFGDDKG